MEDEDDDEVKVEDEDEVGICSVCGCETVDRCDMCFEHCCVTCQPDPGYCPDCAASRK